MEIFQIAGIGILSTVIIVILKDLRPEFALLTAVVTGVVIFSMILGSLIYVVNTISSLQYKVDISISYFNTVLRIMGMAYLVEFASQISRDAGADSVAMKIEFGGKVLIMAMATPILLALMDLIIQILP